MNAWNGNELTKSKAIERLVAKMNAGELVPGHLTPFDVVLEGDAPRESESRLGIPVPLAFIINEIFSKLPADKAGPWVIEMLSAIVPGAQLDHLATSCLFATLTTLKALVLIQIERATPGVTVNQLEGVEKALRLLKSSQKNVISPHDVLVIAVHQLPSSQILNYIPQAAASTVISSTAPHNILLPGKDWFAAKLARKVEQQSAALDALIVIRETAKFVADEALQNFVGEDVEAKRRAQNEDLSRFYDALAQFLQLLNTCKITS